MPSAQHAAEQLLKLATRGSLLRNEVTVGLQGAELRVTQRTIATAQDAFVTIVGAAASPASRQTKLRAAVRKLKKLANDANRKRNREDVSAERAGGKAQRREQHRPPTQPARPVQPAAQAPKRDQRTFNNRAVQRKEGRVAKEDRWVEVVRE